MFSGKTLGALLGGESHLTFWQLSQLSSRPKPPREAFVAPPGRANFLPAAWLRSRKSERLFVLDMAGRLVYWQSGVPDSSDGARTGNLYNLDEGVVNLAQVAHDCFIYVRRDREQLTAHRVVQDVRENWSCPLGSALGDSKVLFGGGALWRRQVGGCATRLETKPAETWRIYTPVRGAGRLFDIADITLENGWQGIGLIHTPVAESFGLLALGSKRKTLALYSGQREALYTTSSAISKYTVCPVSGVIAMLTIDRELIVYSVPERQIRLIVNGQGTEHATE